MKINCPNQMVRRERGRKTYRQIKRGKRKEDSEREIYRHRKKGKGRVGGGIYK